MLIDILTTFSVVGVVDMSLDRRKTLVHRYRNSLNLQDCLNG